MHTLVKRDASHFHNRAIDYYTGEWITLAVGFFSLTLSISLAHSLRLYACVCWTECIEWVLYLLMRSDDIIPNPFFNTYKYYIKTIAALQLHAQQQQQQRDSVHWLICFMRNGENDSWEREKTHTPPSPPICITMNNTIAYNLCIILCTAAICQNKTRRVDEKWKLHSSQLYFDARTGGRKFVWVHITSSVRCNKSTMTSKDPSRFTLFRMGYVFQFLLKIKRNIKYNGESIHSVRSVHMVSISKKCETKTKTRRTCHYHHFTLYFAIHTVPIQTWTCGSSSRTWCVHFCWCNFIITCAQTHKNQRHQNKRQTKSEMRNETAQRERANDSDWD